ncbi:cytochrome c oxidase assembly protein [Lysinibacillus sp. NPDC098008]|uniref:cytochrome c oxidase assembly protein n=1 Tax=Lysinibacillus sp. NPDC098008 TaxID=3364146 RepID=UPI003816A1FB
MHAHTQNFPIIVQLILAVPFLIALIAYIVAVILSNQHKKQWPYFHTICWIFGNLCAISTVIGPLASLMHHHFVAHMIGHLLFGMLAPLLMALAAPITLLLRTLPVNMARALSRTMKNRYCRFIRNPIIASILNVGGLWLLYTTPLFDLMHSSLLLYVLIHIHIFLAGYVFTIAFIYIDPTPHPYSYIFRSLILLIALATHSILSKYIYAFPPWQVPAEQAELGAIIMYYGGDTIEIILIVILFYQWFKSTRKSIRLNRIPV